MGDWARHGTTHEEWVALAEQDERSSCYAADRVDSSVAAWLSTAEMQEMRELMQAIVREARKTLPVEGGQRQDINRATHEFLKKDDGTVLHWHFNAFRAASCSRLAGVAAEQAARLDALREAMLARQMAAGKKAEDEAVAQQIERRKSEEAWLKELAWREKIDRTGGVVIETIQL